MFPVEKIARIVQGKLLRRGADTPTRAIHDSRLVRAGDLFVALPGHRSNGHRYVADAFKRGACAALLSDTKDLPGDARNVIVVADPLLALQQLASAWRDTMTTALLVAITGSNGKTTVRNLLGHMLAAQADTFVAPHNYNTEIGLPIAILSMPANTRFGVFELGAERPGDIAALTRILRPSLGILTSVTASHLEGFETIEAVASEKWSLANDLPKDGAIILNADSPHLLKRASTACVPVISSGLSSGDIRGQILQSVPSLKIRVSRHDTMIGCPLIGDHNACNLLLAATAANVLGMNWDLISAQAATFEPIAHRLNPIQTSFGTILDDTYNANPASMAAALHVLSRFGDTDSVRLFVFGDMYGLGTDSARYHREVARLAVDLRIDTILPVGEAAISACRAGDAANVVLMPQEEITGYVLARHTPRQQTAQSMVILIKGSRAMALEALVEELQLRC